MHIDFYRGNPPQAPTKLVEARSYQATQGTARIQSVAQGRTGIFKITRGSCGSLRNGEMRQDLAVVNVLFEQSQPH